MSHHHSDRQLAEYHQDPRFRRLLFASLGAHLAALLLFSGVLLPRYQRDLRPVYHVDLVNLPVMSPQAGRPDARPPKPQAKAPAPEPAKAPPKPAARPDAVKLAKPAVQPKKPEAAPRPAVSATEQKALEDTMRRMQARREFDDLKQQLAQLGAKDSRHAAAVPGAPVGSPTGKGTEEGTAWDEWLRTFFKSNWSLSKYQVSRLDLEAKVRIVYDAQGNLVDYTFLKASGDATFDDSVKKAILFEKQLPKKPKERLEIDVVFNLKELLK